MPNFQGKERQPYTKEKRYWIVNPCVGERGYWCENPRKIYAQEKGAIYVENVTIE